ncbi:MAG: queuosine precursor transporter [Hyphomicrobiaceae bacterium]
MTEPRKAYRYYDFVMAAFVTVLICSNVIGPAKVTETTLPIFGTIGFSAAVLYFPISYVFGDILTEVYGYARARRVIWTGFAALLFTSFLAWVVVQLPPASYWTDQAAYETVFGSTWRIAAASMVAYWAGEFVNSYILAKMKVWMEGRQLWKRTIGSTLFGQAVDTSIFFPLAFLGSGLIPDEALPAIMLVEYVLKVMIEVLLTPATYAIVGFLKRAENEDYYDRETDFTPFSMQS